MPRTFKASPDPTELRTFGFLLGGFLVGVFGVAVPLYRQLDFQIWPWLVAVLLVVLASLAPNGLRPLYTLWMSLTRAIGAVMNRLVLGLIFFGLLLPIGLGMRLLRRDVLERRWDRDTESYRIPSVHREPDHLNKPF